MQIWKYAVELDSDNSGPRLAIQQSHFINYSSVIPRNSILPSLGRLGQPSGQVFSTRVSLLRVCFLSRLLALEAFARDVSTTNIAEDPPVPHLPIWQVRLFPSRQELERDRLRKLRIDRDTLLRIIRHMVEEAIGRSCT